MNIIANGTKIWASVVKPGMVILTEDGTRIAVETTTEAYSTIIFTENGRVTSVDYGAQVELLGYFNP